MGGSGAGIASKRVWLGVSIGRAEGAEDAGAARQVDCVRRGNQLASRTEGLGSRAVQTGRSAVQALVADDHLPRRTGAGAEVSVQAESSVAGGTVRGRSFASSAV